MKKAIAVLALLVGTAPVPAMSQSSIVSQIAGDAAATEKFHFSLKFGLNVSYLTGAAEIEHSGGFDVGIMATIGLTDRLSITPELAPLSRKGVAAIPFDTTGDPALDAAFENPDASALVLSYVDLPVLVKYRLGRFHIGAGPYLGFLTSATERFRVENGEGEILRYRREATANYEKTDYGIAFEASWTITKPRRGQGLIFHFRYQAGFADVLEGPGGPLRNSVFQAYVSFPFVR
jgi:hypothetical protein